MSNSADDAAALFKQGFNCAQSVLATCGARFGLERDLALRLAGSFGGGMGHMGEVCGAAAGAFMVIGLKYAFTDQRDLVAKQKGIDLVREFTRRFKQRNGSIICREVLGYDLSTPEGMQKARDSGVFDTVCARMVRDAAEILDDLFPDSKEAQTDG